MGITLSSEISNVIKVFSKFLDQKLVKNFKKLETIDDILQLPINFYKFLEKDDIEILKNRFKVFNIEEAAKLNKDNPFEKLIDLKKKKDPAKIKELQKEISEIKKEHPDLENNLKKAITISSLIVSIKEETIEIDKRLQKVVVVGLDNAGKTAVLSSFGKKLGIRDLKDIASLKPTVGVKRKVIESSNLELFVWDMGGQEQYRDKYLVNPEKYFLYIDLLIYVIDVQDSEKFEKSYDYFDRILDTLIALEENPYILIFIHKYDPDLKDKPEIILNVEFLKDILKELFGKKKYNFDYEIYLTSIFNLISNEPKFSKYIKEVMKSHYSITDPTVLKVEGLGKILEETMNAIIRLSESISLSINDIDTRLTAIENSMSQAIAPKEIQTTYKSAVEVDTRSNVLNELKDLFERKKKLDI